MRLAHASLGDLPKAQRYCWSYRRRKIGGPQPDLRTTHGASLFPRKYRLLQLGHTGVAAGEHLAELVNQRRRRCVNELTGMTKPDDAPRTLGDRHEVERVPPLDFLK